VNTPRPDYDDRDSLSAALQRDAAGIHEPPFDAALHHATLRRIRALADSEAARWKPVLAWAAMCVVLAAGIGLWLSRGSQTVVAHRSPPKRPDFSAVLASTRAAAAGLAAGDATPLPAWMSPTASLLELPRFSPINPKEPL
jgi:hypothetical protein